jgi:hypothetical protein
VSFRSYDLKVGDRVKVGIRCLGNPANTPAVAVGHDGHTVFLLFPNGDFDGFSTDDLRIFDVLPVGHDPLIADYKFISAMRLYDDFRAGRFRTSFA